MKKKVIKMTKYIGTKEASRLTGYSIQTVYNKIHKGAFVEGLHYFKPTPRKILFSRDAIINWVEGKARLITSENPSEASTNTSTDQHTIKATKKHSPNNYINI
jgi:predicted DNA-binding transcriptional regulator AlpA